MSIVRHEPAGIYSKVVEANGFVYTAGITPKDLTVPIEGQTRQVLAEIDRLLALCGTDKSKILQATIWVSHIRAREALNVIWTEWTGGNNLPARACVEAQLADPRMQVEIAVVAVK